MRNANTGTLEKAIAFDIRNAGLMTPIMVIVNVIPLFKTNMKNTMTKLFISKVMAIERRRGSRSKK
jgi:hypothetical protein